MFLHSLSLLKVSMLLNNSLQSRRITLLLMYLRNEWSHGMGYLLMSLSFWSYYLREMFGAELCIYIVLFLLSYKKTQKINLTKYMHFSSLYWKLKFLSVCCEISAFLRERKKKAIEEEGDECYCLCSTSRLLHHLARVWETDSVSFLSLRIFANLLGIKQVLHLHS